MSFTGSHDEIARLRLLQHAVHGIHVFAGESPVAFCFEVA